MKNRYPLILAFLFFIFFNCQYFLEEYLGKYLLLIFTTSILFVVILFTYLLFSLQKLSTLKEYIAHGVIILILSCYIISPFGLINFKKFESPTLLFANYEGSASCNFSLYLYKDYTFKKRDVCFGVMIEKGTYSLKNDSIFLSNNEYGVILKNKKSKHKTLILVKQSRRDTIMKYNIIFNKLN